MNTFPWTPALIEQVLEMWFQKGMTSTAIAMELGTSKNSIIGKVHREQAKRGIPNRSHIKRPSKPNNHKARRKPAVSEAPVGFVLRTKPQEPSFINEGQLASIVDVTGCRWAVRDDPSFVGGHAFCNAPQDGNSPYCAYHRTVNVARDSNRQINKTISAAIHRYKKVA